MYKWQAGPHRPIKKWPRWLMVGLALVYIIALAAMFMPKTFGQAQNRPTQLASSYLRHTVRPGDTLWSIARHHRPEKDPREIVFEIRQINGVSPMIYPGQALWVPMKEGAQ